MKLQEPVNEMHKDIVISLGGEGLSWPFSFSRGNETLVKVMRPKLKLSSNDEPTIYTFY